jgi:hypothetical protein
MACYMDNFALRRIEHASSPLQISVVDSVQGNDHSSVRGSYETRDHTVWVDWTVI